VTPENYKSLHAFVRYFPIFGKELKNEIGLILRRVLILENMLLNFLKTKPICGQVEQLVIPRPCLLDEAHDKLGFASTPINSF